MTDAETYPTVGNLAAALEHRRRTASGHNPQEKLMVLDLPTLVNEADLAELLSRGTKDRPVESDEAADDIRELHRLSQTNVVGWIENNLNLNEAEFAARRLRILADELRDRAANAERIANDIVQRFGNMDRDTSPAFPASTLKRHDPALAS